MTAGLEHLRLPLTEARDAARRALLPVAATTAVAYATWSAAGLGHRRYLVLLAAPALLAVLFTRTRLVAGAMIAVGVLGSGFNEVFAAPLGALRLTPFQLLGLALLGWGFTRWALGVREHVDRLLRRALLLLGLAVGVGLVTAVLRGGEFRPAQVEARGLLLYCVALPLFAVYREKRDLEGLEAWVIRFTTVLSFIAVVGAFVPLGRWLSLNGLLAPGGDQVSTLGTVTTAARVRPEFLNVDVIALFLVAAGPNAALGRAWRWLAGSTYVALFLLSFTRSTWIALLVAFAVWWRGHPAARGTLKAAAAGSVAVVLALVAFSLASSGRLGHEGSALAFRISSLGNSQATQEVSYTDRADENRAALHTLEGSPVFGVGLGQTYGASVRIRDPLTHRPAYVPRTFLHNQYLLIWLHLGLFGLAVFAALASWIARTAVRARTRLNREADHVVAAACGLLALGVQALFQTSLDKPAVVTATLLGLVLMRGWYAVGQAE